MVVHTRSRHRRAATAVTSLIAVGAMVAACDSGSTGSDAASSSSSAAAPAPANPQAAVAQPLPDNAVDNALGKLDGLVDSLMSSTKIPGMAVAVVHGGKTLYAKGFGVKDVKTGEKVDPDTVFQLASLSKSISSTVVAQQVGTKAIGWDTPIVST